MSDKKRGQRPAVPETPTMTESGTPQSPPGYTFSFTLSPGDSQALAAVAHRHGVAPGDVMRDAVSQFLAGIRAGVLR